MAVADLNSFSQAAERCFVSQPTLSTQIKKIEHGLGVVIFERTNRSVRLTDAGEVIIAAARRVLGEVDLIEEIAASTHDPFAGIFRLGAITTLASYVFPAAVERIAAALPKLKLLLIEEKTHVLVEQLRNGHCDAAMLALPFTDQALVAMKLFDDPFLLALPANHSLAKAGRASPQS
ncbi:MAG: LysR substrate-binding domain-containing protein, partial [Acidobacteria bacterium]|nr:LysR substrate-binding domain-containing protein [Acidobacteriota bacterium]